MHYESHEATAMILPLPVALPANEASVRWRNLKDYPDLFDDLERGFPMIQRHSGSKGLTATAAAPLAVHDVGDYIASFVPRVDDFARLDPRFSIGKDVWSAIPEYADYGFAVFQLKELQGSTHPIAFEFQTRLNDALYFPTVHIHDGTVHEKDAFDHVLYLQEATFDASAGDYEGPGKVDESTNWVRSQGKASAYVDDKRALGLVTGNLLLHKTTMMGMLPNKDTFVGTSPKPTAAQGGCSRCAAAGAPPAIGPAAMAVVGLGWLIRRREKLRSKMFREQKRRDRRS